MKEKKVSNGLFCHSDLRDRCSSLYHLYIDLISNDYSAVDLENHTYS